jgi:hypothetical protein
MLIIPLQAIPNQTLTVTLSDQVTQLNVYQTYNGLFIDVLVENVLIIGGVICENQNRIVRSDYLGFSGDLAFIDTQGSDDPIYTGLGTRFFLTYLTTEELAAT